MWTAHSGPSLFDHLKSVFFNSTTAMFIFTILLDSFLQIFHTHKTEDSNDASTSFFLLFSLLLIFLRLLLHRDFSRFTRWGMSGLLFFFCSDFREEIFALFFFCSDFPKDAPLEFPRRETCSKGYFENWIWQLQDLKPQPSSLFTIGKIFAGIGDWTQVCTPNHVFDAFTAKQHWCRHEN